MTEKLIKIARWSLLSALVLLFMVSMSVAIKQNESVSAVAKPAFLTLQKLSDKYNGYYYVNTVNPGVTVSIGLANWSFSGNEDGSVTLIRGTVRYGDFKKTDAWVEPNGDFMIKEAMFLGFFDIITASSHGYEKSILKNMGRFLGNKLLYTNAADMAGRLKFKFGSLSGTAVPDAEAVLASELETSVKAQKVNLFWPLSHYNVNETIVKILSFDDELQIQSRALGVPKELIAAVIFREMICFDILDELFDYRYRATKGLAQISLDGAEFNEIDGKTDNEYKYNRQQLKKMLTVEKESIYLAAVALKARANLEKIFIGTEDQIQIELIFSRYNDTPKAWNSVGSALYGGQTFEYYKAFKKYFEIADKNRITIKN